jgi:HPt (histidine-containing phosphotransfer) domain-containing protein
MSQRLNAYFTREAGEYLEQMEALLSQGDERPDTAKLVRLTRGARGSAQMAGATGLAPVTERLEAAARSLDADTLRWTGGLSALLTQTVRELNELLAATAAEWGNAERARVDGLVSRWDSLGREEDGAAPADPTPADAVEDVVPISTLFFDDGGPHVVAPGGGSHGAADPDPGPGADDVVPIETLLFRGPAAARAALALRGELDRITREGAAAGELAPLHAEIFDLVELSIPEATA